MKITATIQVAHREMRQVEIMHFPWIGWCPLTVDSAAEKRQFEAKAMAILRLKISSEIPPLRLKVWVPEEILREFEPVAGHCLAVLEQMVEETRLYRPTQCY